jgi:hypothetical protein
LREVLIDHVPPIGPGTYEAIVPLPDETLAIEDNQLTAHLVHQLFIFMCVREKHFNWPLHRYSDPPQSNSPASARLASPKELFRARRRDAHPRKPDQQDPKPPGQDASMRILHADGANHPNPNENTLVVRLDLGTTRVLLMGDAPGGPRANPSTPPTVGSIEQVLVTCCANALAAQILVVGHHGSMTSSRTAFLDAIGPSIAAVSAGPMQYGTVTLPDQSIVTELQSRGQFFRTDVDDAGCGKNPNKIGPDADGEPWGCTNIRIVLKDSVLPQVTVWNGS